MNKVILKTALGTIAVLAFAAFLVFSLWILISPQTMASYCEKTGNYSFAVTCSDLRYKYTGDINDLARCTQNGISAQNDKLIVKYGEKLVADEGFKELCKKKDNELSDYEYAEYTSSYERYVCGNLSAAQYRTGDLEAAIRTASSAEAFSYTKLIIEVIENGSKDEAKQILSELETISGYGEPIIKLLQEFAETAE